MKHILKKIEIPGAQGRPAQSCAGLPCAPTCVSRTSRAFTLVETLVAITVLMIAIAGPLVVASKGLRSSLAAKDQMIASYLAQETMEVIKNFKDNDFDQGYYDAWLSNISPGGECIYLISYCDMHLHNDGNFTVYDSCGENGCPLYYNSNFGYTLDYNNGGQPTIFTRRYYLEAVTGTNADKEILAHVIVEWKEGTVPYQIHITSNILNTNR